MPTGDSHSTLFLVSGLGLASFFGAFGVSLGLAKRRSPDAFSLSHSNPAAQLALRALGLGTLCAVLGVGGVALSVKYAFGIHSVSIRETVTYIILEVELLGWV